jgi:hypothetical protein
MFDDDAFFCESFIFRFLFRREFVLRRFLMRKKEFLARIVLVKADKPQVEADLEMKKPLLFRRKFVLEHFVIMRLADPTVTQV